MSTTRKTISAPAELRGTGIHTGLATSVRFEPAAPGEGLVLVDARGRRCPASIEFADADRSDRRTVLVSPEGVAFEQMEHVLAALAAHGISDCTIVQGGVEPPFMGGGCAEFMDAIAGAGISDLGVPWEVLAVTEPVCFRDGGALMTVSPAEELELSAFVEFPGTVVGSSGANTLGDAASFRREAAPARTFALARDVEMIRAAGLGKGGSLDNTVIFDHERFHNGTLHFPNEPARHKLIDLLGDLALLGVPLAGHFSAWRAGHRSHVRFARFIQQEMASRR